MLAASLEEAGAAALSVLTEEDFFLARSDPEKSEPHNENPHPAQKISSSIPWQVWETRAAGADSFLLIAAVLNDSELRGLLELGRTLRMEALVEVHSREELQHLLDAGAHYRRERSRFP